MAAEVANPTPVANGTAATNGTNGTNGIAADGAKTNGAETHGFGGDDFDSVVNYFKPPPEGLPYMSPKNVEILVGTGHMDTHPARIYDARPNDMYKKFNMEDNGFQFVKHKSEFIDIDYFSDEEVKSKCYPEVEKLVMDVTGAKSCVAFQHVYRASTPKKLGLKEGKQAGTGPLGRAHIDLSLDGGWTRMKIYSENEEIAKQRWDSGVVMISVWRPIKTVERDPLAVMDYQTLPDEDMVPFANPLHLKDGVHRLERLTILPNPDHKWYYLNEQTNEDVIFVKFVDTRNKDVRMTGCPHTAIVKPGTEDRPARESLETRVMAFF